jgi:MFS family permease
MRATLRRRAEAARLCALGGGFQVVWGAVLAVSLQERIIALGGASGAVQRYGIVAAVGAGLATVVQIAAGAGSDAVRARTGDRTRFYAAGVLLAMPALAWFYLTSSVVEAACAFFALQVAINVAGGPYQAIIPDYVAPERRGAASSWMAGYQSLGNAAGLLLAGFVHDLRTVAAVLGAQLLGACSVTAAHARGLAAHSGRENAPPLSLRGPLGVLLVSRGLANVGFYVLLGFLLFFVRESLRVPVADVTMQTALIFLTFTLSAIAGAVAAAKPTDRRDKRLVISVAVSVVVVALSGLAFASALPAAYASAALAGAGWGAFVTADWALATTVLPGTSMATAMGVWNVATTLPQVVAPLLAAPLVAQVDALQPGAGPRAAVGLAVVALAAGAVSVWRLPRS